MTTDKPMTRVLVAGASGASGRCVVQALLSRSYQVIAVVRPETAWSVTHERFEVVRADVSREPQWYEGVTACDAVVSCLASRTGGLEDARRVEFDANRNVLAAAEHWQVKRFLLLSAICVQKPRLAFQKEKLRFEDSLKQSAVPWTIVRPTAFFRSLSGQVGRVQAGKAFLVFGNGALTACKPIAGGDLADFMVDRLEDAGAAGKLLPIGGPGPALTPNDQVALLARLLNRPIKTRSVPPGFFLVLARLFDGLGWLLPRCRDRAEFLRIAHFYATESMLVWDAAGCCYRPDQTPETGAERLEDFYSALLSGDAQAELREHKLF